MVGHAFLTCFSVGSTNHDMNKCMKQWYVYMYEKQAMWDWKIKISPMEAQWILTTALQNTAGPVLPAMIIVEGQHGLPPLSTCLLQYSIHLALWRLATHHQLDTVYFLDLQDFYRIIKSFKSPYKQQQ